MDKPKPEPKKCEHPDCDVVVENPWKLCNKHLGERSYVGPLSILHMRIREKKN